MKPRTRVRIQPSLYGIHFHGVIFIGAPTPIRFEQTNGRLRHLQIPTTPATAPSRTAVETLRTATSVGMKLSDVVDPRMLDQPSAAVIDDHNIPFGFPDEGIVNLYRLADGRAEELGKMDQDQWMSAARCAHDAILEEQEPAHAWASAGSV